MLRKQKINESEVMKFGFLGGIAEAGYIFCAASTMMVLDKISPPHSGSLAAISLVLMFFVFSAAISGILVFGYPVYLAFQKRYSEALMTALTTLVTLVVVGILFFMLISFI